jgi:DNA-binding MarR family transcriptional regulator
MNDPSEPFSDQVFHHLLSLIHHTRRYSRKIIHEKELTPRDFSVLLFLLESGSATVGQVQAFIHKSPSTTSTLIAQLEGKGYLTRSRDPQDNRVVNVTLTASGQKIAESTPLGGLPLLRRRLARLSQRRLEEIDLALTELLALIQTAETE